MIVIEKTDQFNAWLGKLRDRAARQRINLRIRHVSMGSLGDARSVGDGVHELRIH